MIGTVNAGHEIIAALPLVTGNDEYAVTAKRSDGQSSEYVTWLTTWSGNDFYWGHYFGAHKDGRALAIADMIKRAGY